MSDAPRKQRWVNAVIEVLVPTDVAVDAPDEEKQEAVAKAMERLDLPDDAVATGRWEVVDDG